MAGKGLDRNTIIGLVVIFGLILGYSIFTRPSEEEIEAAKRKQDSLRTVVEEQARKEAEEKARQDSLKNLPLITAADSVLLKSDTSAPVDSARYDSLLSAKLNDKFGAFATAATGEQKLFTIENNRMKLTLSSKGGRIYSVELKEYTKYNGSPLILFDGDTTRFGMNFFLQNRSIITDEMYFTSVSSKENILVSDKPDSISMRLYAGDEKYIEYRYVLYPDSYMADFNITFNNMRDLISENTSYIDFKWEIDVPGQEKGHTYENNYSAIYYKYLDGEVDNLSETSSSKKELTTKLKWIGFKQQFFSSVLIAKGNFSNAIVEQVKFDEGSPYLKHYIADITLPFSGNVKETIPFNFYFGPNHFNTLRKYGKEKKLDLERLVPIGWSFFLMHWINRYVVIPVFNFLMDYIGNFGLIILILTILLKLVLFPLTFRSFMSTAKMRVLRPQIDEINKRIPKDKAMERQKATMELYKKVGVSPMGGCLPMVLQFPILIAMFRFFPASIELRQQSFLWADDLSAYDSIATLPFSVPFGYGDHISLFTLLMTISTIIYTYLNAKNTPQTQSMPGMKVMMYLMPIMFLFFFNNYAAALSYYYLLANLITFLQMYIFKKLVNDEDVLKKLEVGKKKPATKSKFMERLEQAQKQRYKPKK